MTKTSEEMRAYKAKWARENHAKLTPEEKSARSRAQYARRKASPKQYKAALARNRRDTESKRGTYVPDYNVTDDTAEQIERILDGAERGSSRKPRGFTLWTPQSETIKRLAQVQGILKEYEAHLPLTGRQIYYRMIGKHGYIKGKEFENNLYDILRRARRARLIPMDAIRDDGGKKVEPNYFAGAEQWLSSVRNWSQRVKLDRQVGQPKQLIFYCEAAGMVPQIAAVVGEYGIPVLSSGGMDSITEKHLLGRDNDGTEVLHIGDLDPAGIHMFIALAEDVSAFAHDYGHTIDFTRLAVTPEQVIALDLITEDVDEDNKIAYPHDFTCQAEAIAPDDLAKIVRKAVKVRLDVDAYNTALEREEKLHKHLTRRLKRV